jgi:hypothetical protein
MILFQTEKLNQSLPKLPLLPMVLPSLMKMLLPLTVELQN